MNLKIEEIIKKIEDRWYNLAPFSKIEIDYDHMPQYFHIRITWFIKGDMLTNHVIIHREDIVDLANTVIDNLYKEYVYSRLNYLERK